CPKRIGRSVLVVRQKRAEFLVLLGGGVTIQRRQEEPINTGLDRLLPIGDELDQAPLPRGNHLNEWAVVQIKVFVQAALEVAGAVVRCAEEAEHVAAAQWTKAIV